MASEYLKWLAKDDKPAQKRELTPQEKRKNWWHYHKWIVLIVVLAVAAVGSLIRDIVRNLTTVPDYSIAFIGSADLPDDTVEALEAELAALGEDLNGDGKVLVKVNQYLLDSDIYSYKVPFMADIQDCTSFVFLLEDPEGFQEHYELLAYPDGTIPEEGAAVSEELWYSWADCPVLAGLSLGSYDTGFVQGDSQELLGGMYVARRAFFPDGGVDEQLAEDTAFWQALTEGAQS